MQKRIRWILCVGLIPATLLLRGCLPSISQMARISDRARSLLWVDFRVSPRGFAVDIGRRPTRRDSALEQRGLPPGPISLTGHRCTTETGA